MLTHCRALILKLKTLQSFNASTHASFSFKPLSFLLQGRIPTSHLLQIHAQVFRTGVNQDNLIATRLIGHYSPQSALKVFHSLITPNIFPFNAIIRVVSEKGLLVEAFSIFKILNFRSVCANGFTLSFLLKACFRTSEARNVKQVHTHVVKLGFECDSCVCNGLLAVYAKGVKDLDSTRRLFDEMPERGAVFCWNCLIRGYAQLGRSEEALRVFVKMVEENLVPEDDDTLVSVLSACSTLGTQEIERWEKIIAEFGVHNTNINNLHRESVDTVLVYLYGKVGDIHRSREIFDGIILRGKSRSVIHWNAMISAYVQNGFLREALSVFKLMLVGPYPRPNHVTMVSVLSACAQVGDIDLGKWVHEYLKVSGRKDVLHSNTYLATALIDMYSKCGTLENAKDVFYRMASKDVVSFNAMIMGLAVNGQGEEALRLFSKMKEFGVNPNGGTFLGVLSACSHSGMIDEGRQTFLSMVPHYFINPELEHYACYIDLLSRVGNVEEALEVVSSMTIEPNGLVWGALLQGCLMHSKLDVAWDIASRLVKVDPVNSAGYVMLSNLYASDHRWGKILDLRELMREKEVRKQPGRSWIRINGVVHEFLVGSYSHPEIQSICNMLRTFSKEMLSLGPLGRL